MFCSLINRKSREGWEQFYMSLHAKQVKTDEKTKASSTHTFIIEEFAHSYLIYCLFLFPEL